MMEDEPSRVAAEETPAEVRLNGNAAAAGDEDEEQVVDEAVDGNAQDASVGGTAVDAKKKKKKKKKGGTKGSPGPGVQQQQQQQQQPSCCSSQQSCCAGGADAGEKGMSPNATRDMQKVFQKIFIEQQNSKQQPKKDKSYEFWDTQPVPKLGESIEADVNEPVEADKEHVRAEPFSLPGGFTWDTLDIENTEQLKELYTLLNENYVEDDDNMFRFDYSPTFLRWALCPPGWKSEWHCCVRVATNKKLVGFISAIPARISVLKKQVEMVEINFLCVHKKLRSKRVAPVLIREITRRVNLEGIFQAAYTAGVVLPKPVGTCRYWHRSLNPKKLIDVKFSHLKRNMTMQRTIKLYKLPDSPKISTLRPLTREDLPSAHALLMGYLQQFDLAPMFTLEDFTHWFSPLTDVVVTYVTTDEVTGEVDNLLSFYQLPSTVVDHPRYKSLKAAYSFYNVAKKNSLYDLVNDALVIAKNDNYDVFNALNLMENGGILEDLKFGIGDGNLNYYLYNWKCPSIEAANIGLVLQ